MILNEMTQNKPAMLGAQRTVHRTSTTESDFPSALLLSVDKPKPVFKNLCQHGGKLRPSDFPLAFYDSSLNRSSGSVLLKAFSWMGQVQPYKEAIRVLEKMHTLPHLSYVQVLQHTASLEQKIILILNLAFMCLSAEAYTEKRNPS